jgi:DNA-binding PadR family transcriptional regulator
MKKGGGGGKRGELEELVLLKVGSLRDEAYGVYVMDEIRDQTGRSLNVSAIHAVLKRLENKGYVRSQMGGATQERGGRRKRLFVLTAAGKSALDQSMQYRLELYKKIPDISFNFSRT